LITSCGRMIGTKDLTTTMTLPLQSHSRGAYHYQLP
jgi:hypothetical protein